MELSDQEMRFVVACYRKNNGSNFNSTEVGATLRISKQESYDLTVILEQKGIFASYGFNDEADFTPNGSIIARSLIQAEVQRRIVKPVEQKETPSNEPQAEPKSFTEQAYDLLEWFYDDFRRTGEKAKLSNYKKVRDIPDKLLHELGKYLASHDARYLILLKPEYFYDPLKPNSTGIDYIVTLTADGIYSAEHRMNRRKTQQELKPREEKRPLPQQVEQVLALVSDHSFARLPAEKRTLDELEVRLGFRPVGGMGAVVERLKDSGQVDYSKTIDGYISDIHLTSASIRQQPQQPVSSSHYHFTAEHLTIAGMGSSATGHVTVAPSHEKEKGWWGIMPKWIKIGGSILAAIIIAGAGIKKAWNEYSKPMPSQPVSTSPAHSLGVP